MPAARGYPSQERNFAYGANYLCMAGSNFACTCGANYLHQAQGLICICVKVGTLLVDLR